MAVQEKSKKKVRKSLFLKLVLLCVIIYLLVNFIMSRMSPSYTSYIVQNGYLEEFVTVDGYIFREQTKIDAPVGGILECEAGEEERVAQGEYVASIHQAGIDTAANERLKKISAEIKRLEQDTLQKDVYINDIARLELQIAGETKSLSSLAYRRQWDSIADLKENINRLIDKKRTASGEKEPDDVILEQLRAEKAEIEQANQVESVALTAPCPGVFTARIDGMEDVLSMDRLDELSPEYLDQLDQMTVQSREEIVAGEPACKIVSNAEWCLAARVSADEAKLFNEGESVRLRFFDRTDEAIDGKVIRIVRSGNGSGPAVLLVQSSGYADSVYVTSRANVEIIKKRYEGLKIPTQCVRVKDGSKCVYVLRGDVAKQIPIELLYNNNEWAVISSQQSSDNGLKLYDEVIVHAEAVEDGKKLR